MMITRIFINNLLVRHPKELSKIHKLHLIQDIQKIYTMSMKIINSKINLHLM